MCSLFVKFSKLLNIFIWIVQVYECVFVWLVYMYMPFGPSLVKLLDEFYIIHAINGLTLLFGSFKWILFLFWIDWFMTTTHTYDSFNADGVSADPIYMHCTTIFHSWYNELIECVEDYLSTETTNGRRLFPFVKCAIYVIVCSFSNMIRYFIYLW